MLDQPIEISIPIPQRDNAPIVGPGARLRQIREARHLSLEEMAKRVRLSPERLTQIEHDDYRQMGASAFARGYLRSYAGQLGISQQETTEILRVFDELNLGAEIPSKKPQLIHENISQVTPNTARRFGYLLVLLVIVLVGYWWYNHSNLIPKPAADTATTATAAPSDSGSPATTTSSDSGSPAAANTTAQATIDNSNGSGSKAELEVLPPTPSATDNKNTSDISVPALPGKNSAATTSDSENSTKAR